MRNLHQIALRYLQGEFIRDLIPLLPLTFIFDHDRKFVKLLYVIKVVRVLNGFKVFDTHKIYKALQLRSQERLAEEIKKNPAFAEDQLVDHNQITTLMFTNYSVKVLKLAIVILNASYFAGMFWLIFCELTLFFRKDATYLQITQLLEKKPYMEPEDACAGGLEVNPLVKVAGLSGLAADCKALERDLLVLADKGFFLAYYGIEDYEPRGGLIELGALANQSLIVMYWAFTTLSTVGFGDYNPRSDGERLMCAFFMLFGVAIFSYIMGIFIEILDQF